MANTFKSLEIMGLSDGKEKKEELRSAEILGLPKTPKTQEDSPQFESLNIMAKEDAPSIKEINIKNLKAAPSTARSNLARGIFRIVTRDEANQEFYDAMLAEENVRKAITHYDSLSTEERAHLGYTEEDIRVLKTEMRGRSEYANFMEQAGAATRGMILDKKLDFVPEKYKLSDVEKAELAKFQDETKFWSMDLPALSVSYAAENSSHIFTALVSAPLGGAGIAITGTTMFGAEAQDSYDQMMNAGVSPEIAERSAFLAGATKAPLEYAEIKSAVRSPVTSLKELAKLPWLKRILIPLQKAGLNIGNEIVQENLQTAVDWYFLNQAITEQNNTYGTSLSPVSVDTLKEDLVHSTKAAAALGVGGQTTSTVVNVPNLVRREKILTEYRKQQELMDSVFDDTNKAFEHSQEWQNKFNEAIDGIEVNVEKEFGTKPISEIEKFIQDYLTLDPESARTIVDEQAKREYYLSEIKKHLKSRTEADLKVKYLEEQGGLSTWDGFAIRSLASAPELTLEDLALAKETIDARRKVYNKNNNTRLNFDNFVDMILTNDKGNIELKNKFNETIQKTAKDYIDHISDVYNEMIRTHELYGEVVVADDVYDLAEKAGVVALDLDGVLGMFVEKTGFVGAVKGEVGTAMHESIHKITHRMFPQLKQIILDRYSKGKLEDKHIQTLYDLMHRREYIPRAVKAELAIENINNGFNNAEHNPDLYSLLTESISYYIANREELGKFGDQLGKELKNFIGHKLFHNFQRLSEDYSNRPVWNEALNRFEESEDALRGTTTFLQNGKAYVELFKNATRATLPHELGHVFFHTLSAKELGQVVQYYSKKRGRDVTATLEEIRRYMNDPRQSITPTVQDLHEFFANNMVAFLREGIAPDSSLRKLFQQYRAAIMSVWKKASSIPYITGQLDSEVREIFNNAFSVKPLATIDTTRVISIEGQKVKLYSNTAMTRAYKEFLGFIKQGYASLAGLHAELRKYAEIMLGEKIAKSAEVKLLVTEVASNADAMKALNKIDSIAYKIQRKEVDNAVKRIKTTLKSLDLDKWDFLYKNKLMAELEGISLKKFSPQRISSLQGLQAYIEKELQNKNNPLDEWDIPVKYLKELTELSKRNIYDMSVEEINRIHEVITSIASLKNLKDQLTLKGKLVSMTETIQNAREEVKNTRRKKTPSDDFKFASQARNVGEIITTSSKNPEKLLYYLSGYARDTIVYKIYEELHDGYTKSVEMQNDAHEWMRTLTQMVDTTGWSQYTLPTGKKLQASDLVQIQAFNAQGKVVQIPITKAQRVTLYNYLQNDKARAHLIGNGKIRLSQRETETYTLSDDFLKQMVSQMSVDEIIVGNAMIKYYDTVIKPMINKVSKDLVLRELAVEENYFPLYVEWMSRGSTETLNKAELTASSRQFIRRVLEHSSFLQERTDNKQPIWIYDSFQVMERNVSAVSSYVGLAQPLRYAKTIVNDYGNAKKRGFRSYVQLGWGKDWVEYLDEYIRRVEGEIVPTTKQRSELKRARQISTLVVLGYNIGVSAIQRISVIMYNNYTSSSSFYKALALNMVDPKGLGGLKPRHSIEEMSSWDPLLKKRFEEGSNIDLKYVRDYARTRNAWIAPTNVTHDILNLKSPSDFYALMHKIMTEKSFDWIKTNDAWALSVGYDAVRMDVERETGLEGEALHEATMKKFMYVTNQTQPNFNPVDMSNFIGDNDPGLKLLFSMFKTQFMQYRNEVEYRVREANHQMKQADSRLAKANIMRETFVKIARVLFTSQILAAIVSETLFELGADDDEKERSQDYGKRIIIKSVQNMTNMVPILGPAMSSFVTRAMGGNVYTGNDLVSEVYFRSADTFGQAVKSFSDGEIEEAWMKMLKGIGQGSAAWMGYPIMNLAKDVKYATNIVKKIGE